MAKIKRGRLNGHWGMASYTAAELHAWANRLERVARYTTRDDPRYLRRWAKKIRRLANAKDKAIEHKQSQGKRRPRDRRRDQEFR